MKKLLYSFSVCALLISTSTCPEDKKPEAKPSSAKATADKPATRDFSNVKIAYIDGMVVFGKYKGTEEKGKMISEALQADVEARNKKIEKMTAEYKKKEAELKNMGNAAKASAKEEKQKELINLESSIKVEVGALQEIPQRKFQEAQEKAQMEIFEKIKATTDQLAKAHKIDLVIGGSALFVEDRLDITDLVIEELNKNYKPAIKPKPAPAKKS